MSWNPSPVEHRIGYRSWIVNRGRHGWELWREADDRPAFASYYSNKLEAVQAKEASDKAAADFSVDRD